VSSGWAAVVIAGLAQAAAIGVLAWRAGRWAGQVTTILDELRRDRDDHGKRLRILEGGRARR